MDRRVTPPKLVTSTTWGPPPPCKQALKHFIDISLLQSGDGDDDHDHDSDDDDDDLLQYIQRAALHLP